MTEDKIKITEIKICMVDKNGNEEFVPYTLENMKTTIENLEYLNQQAQNSNNQLNSEINITPLYTTQKPPQSHSTGLTKIEKECEPKKLREYIVDMFVGQYKINQKKDSSSTIENIFDSVSKNLEENIIYIVREDMLIQTPVYQVEEMINNERLILLERVKNIVNTLESTIENNGVDYI